MELIVGVALLVFGAILGSFVGVVAERMYTGQAWFKGRSKCNSCARTLTARDLVPVLSWLGARGRCFMCGARIPLMYAVFEASLGLLFLLSYLVFGLTLVLPFFLLALVTLTFIVMYDLKHTVVPTNASNLLIVLGGIVAALSSGSVEVFGVSLIIAGTMATAFFLLHLCSGGRAMGLGDAPVVLALSLLCAPYALGGLLLSFWIGAVIGILILVLRKGGPTMGIEVPFVPFLALGYLAAFFFSWNPLQSMLW